MIKTCLQIADEMGNALPGEISYLRPRQSSETAQFCRMESIDLHPEGVEKNDSPRPGRLKTYLTAVITMVVVLNGDINELSDLIDKVEDTFLDTLKNRVEKTADIDYYYLDRQTLNPIEGKHAGEKWAIQYDLRVGRNTSRGR